MYQNQKKYPNGIYQPSYKSYPTIPADTSNNLLFQPTLPSNQVAQNLNLYDKIYNQGGNDSTVQETPQIFGWETYPQSTIQGGQQVQEVSPLFNLGNSSQSIMPINTSSNQTIYSQEYYPQRPEIDPKAIHGIDKHGNPTLILEASGQAENTTSPQEASNGTGAPQPATETTAQAENPTTEQQPPTTQPTTEQQSPTAGVDKSLNSALQNLPSTSTQQENYKLFATSYPTPTTLEDKNYWNILPTIPEEFYYRINQQPLLNNQDLQLGVKLADLKKGHYDRDLLIKGLEEELKNPDLSEEEKVKRQNAIEDYKKEQADIHAYADMLRKGSGSNIDWNNYGFSKDDTLAQTSLALYNQQQRAVRDALGRKSAADVEAEDYSNYVKNGASPFMASIWAYQNADATRRENNAAYADSINTYGINADGSLNSLGVQIANKWAKDDPQSAGIYLQEYASPATQFQARVNLLDHLNTLEHGDWKAILNTLSKIRGQNIDFDKFIKNF